MDEVFLTPKEAADFLRVKVGWIYQKKAQGKLPTKPLGGSWRVAKSELIEWVNSGNAKD